MPEISIIIPAYNEEDAVEETISTIYSSMKDEGVTAEVILVDDGSSDKTADIAEKSGARVIRHPVNLGYGNSIVTGIWASNYDLIGIIDADGTYPAELLPAMTKELLERKLDMLVGARQGKNYYESPLKHLARLMFKALSEFTVGRKIPDINSGQRIFRKSLLMKMMPILCGGFSFTTTITIIAMLTYHAVAYTPIPYAKRKGASKIRYIRDTIASAQILVLTILLFNPLKLYIVLAGLTFIVGTVLGTVILLVPQAAFSLGVMLPVFLTAAVILAISFLADQRTRIALLQNPDLMSNRSTLLGKKE